MKTGWAVFSPANGHKPEAIIYLPHAPLDKYGMGTVSQPLCRRMKLKELGEDPDAARCCGEKSAKWTSAD